MMRQLATMYGYSMRQAYQFSPDSDLLAAATQEGLQLIEIDSAQVVDKLGGGDSVVTASSFDGTGRLVATGHADGSARVWDLRTGKEMATFRAAASAPRARHLRYGASSPQTVSYVRFSADRSRLATALNNGTILIWDTAKISPLPLEGGTADAATLFASLASNDSGDAWRAGWALSLQGQAGVTALESLLQPAQQVDAEQVLGWIEQLDAPRYADRQEAYRRLGQLGMRAVAIMKQAMQKSPSAETLARLQELVEQAQQAVVASPGMLQQTRAIRVLERIGSQQAQRLLQKIADGEQGARLTREAAAALERIKAQGSQD